MTDYPRPDASEPGPVTSEGTAPARPPTFTSWLRGRSDEELATLLTARPDLARPVPADIGALAVRATTRNTVLRVLERLDRFTLQTLEAVVALGDDRLSEPVGAAPADLAAALVTPPQPEEDDPVRDALDTLRQLALVWPDRERLRPVQVLRDLLPEPARLGPPVRALLASTLPHGVPKRLADDLVPDSPATTPVEAVAMLLSDHSRVAELVSQVDPAARRLLDSMAWGPPNGSVSDARREITLATAASPVETLLARALLLPTGNDILTLPREVGLYLRSAHFGQPDADRAEDGERSPAGDPRSPDRAAPESSVGHGTLFPTVATTPPDFEGREHSAHTVGRTAAGQAFTVLRSVDELLEHWSQEPVAVLRNGGLGVRDLRRAAQVMETDEPTAALFVEIAFAAGLIGVDDRLEGEWLPTREYDMWRESPPERRWLRLVTAWLESDRLAALAGSRDSGGRVRNVLSTGLTRPAAPQARRDVLGELGAAAPGFAPLPESLTERLAWRRPRRQSPVYDELVESTLSEAAQLGLTSQGALAAHARPLVLDSDEDAAARALAAELPEPLDYVLIQGDLTAVAPGPLVAELARELALVADVESTGGATVYRFSTDSVRRALDAGRGVADITALLERHSRTPLPQALRYLVSDVGRRHGRLRAGSASSYLRCDEPAVLEELVNDRRADDLGLVRLAPTVVASRVSRSNTVERLRQLGYHPVPESHDGSMRLSRPETRRAAPMGVPAPSEPESPRETAHAAVRAVRAGDEAATVARRPVPLPEDGPPGSRVTAVMDALTHAAKEGHRVWIGYTDTDGRQVSRIVEPSSVDGGFVTAYDATRAAVHRFALHRITAVAELEQTGAE